MAEKPIDAVASVSEMFGDTKYRIAAVVNRKSARMSSDSIEDVRMWGSTCFLEVNDPLRLLFIIRGHDEKPHTSFSSSGVR